MISHKTYEVVKRHGRLHIETIENGLSVYTPPAFVRLPSRAPLKELAATFTALQRRDIAAISEFEGRWTKHA